MSTRLAINGYGRIGRSVLRALYESTEHSTQYAGLRIVAINDLADSKTLAHLTRYDSTHGRFLGEISSDSEQITVAGDRIQVLRHDSLDQLPWRELEVDLVLECSGTFSDRTTAEQHLKQGAKRMLFSQPAQSDVDLTVIYGVNHEQLRSEHRIIANASCTTNCLVPVLKMLQQRFGIEAGGITTIHSAMNDQPVIDSYHNQDLRKTRSAMQSIIPVDTALAKGVERFLPELTGRLEAQAVRVPTLNVSALDLSMQLQQDVTVDTVIAAIKKESSMLPANVLGFTDEPLASCDFNHDPRSAIVDLSQTQVVGSRFLKLLVWFDNEWGYANRMLDVAQLIDQLDT